LDLDSDALDELAAELAAEGAECVTQVCNVTDRQACDRAVAAVVARFGGVDFLINNAGITQRSAFLDTDVDVYRRVMDINFFGSLYCTKAALPHLIASAGQIIVISSVAGFAPLIGRTGYAASKHALHGMFGSLRAELREHDVGVLIVSPSFIKTNININALGGDGEKTRHPQATLGNVMTAQTAARSIVDAAERDRRSLPLGRVAAVAQLLNRVSPALYERAMTRSLAKELRRDPP
jgi:NAD(P)-dependent dehydrogenase (short-subunit alcohol dehydrogenase family)